MIDRRCPDGSDETGALETIGGTAATALTAFADVVACTTVGALLVATVGATPVTALVGAPASTATAPSALASPINAASGDATAGCAGVAYNVPSGRRGAKN